MVQAIIAGQWSSIAETNPERWKWPPICTVVRVLECLEEINREAWREEVTN